jgi:monoterpene epsilon-lactone hydrolase
VPSLRHQLLCFLVPRLRGSTEVVDAEAARVEKLAEQQRHRLFVPARVVSGCTVSEVDGYGFPVHEVHAAGASPTRTVLYLHGGGYVDPADGYHWRYAVRMATRLGVRVVLPHYPLAPRHTWRDSHDALVRLFERLAVESPAGVVLAGDSAGGGYALALAQTVAGRPGPQPTHLVLVAPWVDLTGSVPGTEAAARRDPWLQLSRLHLYAGWWSGGDDVARAELTPLRGNLTGLPPALMWCGTRDLLQPQCRALADAAGGAGWDLTYVERPGLIHVYPILPIPEARVAFAELAGFLGARDAVR